MYKAVKKNNVIRIYMESLAIRTGVETVNSEYNTSFICVVGDKRFPPRVKHIYIPV